MNWGEEEPEKLVFGLLRLLLQCRYSAGAGAQGALPKRV